MKSLLLVLAVVLVGCGKKKDANPSPILTLGAPNSPKAVAAIAAAIRKAAGKPTGELTKADLEKVTLLKLNNRQLTEVPKGLEKLTQLTELNLYNNQLTDVKGLEKLTQLKLLSLSDNPDLTKVQIAELKKALPKCKINHNATK